MWPGSGTGYSEQKRAQLSDKEGILHRSVKTTSISLQIGQKDDFKTTPILFGSRYMQTLAKLPQIAPSIINNINSTN